jgi:hypothetical protein
MIEEEVTWRKSPGTGFSPVLLVEVAVVILILGTAIILGIQ